MQSYKLYALRIEKFGRKFLLDVACQIYAYVELQQALKDNLSQLFAFQVEMKTSETNEITCKSIIERGGSDLNKNSSLRRTYHCLWKEE